MGASKNIYSRIETERLILREWIMDDVDDLVETLSNYNVTKYTNMPFPYTKEEAEKYIVQATSEPNNEKNSYFAIVLKEDEKAIGGTRISRDEKGILSYGIWLNEKYQKNGYGTEAFRELTKFCFNVLNADRIESGFLFDNMPSWKIHKKIGHKLGQAVERTVRSRQEPVIEIKTTLTREDFVT